MSNNQHWELRMAVEELRRLYREARNERDRLAALNAQMLEALNWIDSRCGARYADQPLHAIHKEMAHDAGVCARAAIAAATGGES